MTPEQHVGTLTSLAGSVIGFLAGSIVQWYLQKSKAREAMLRAFSRHRARSLKSLWSKTLFSERLDEIRINDDWRREQDEQFTDWYCNESGALFLSWRATKLYNRAVRKVREGGSERSMQDAFSALRTQLKRDVGIYNLWESWRDVGDPGKPLGDGATSREGRPAQLER